MDKEHILSEIKLTTEESIGSSGVIGKSNCAEKREFEGARFILF
jgi:hypothetical protein